MNIKYLLKGLSFALFSTFALANDCNDLEAYFRNKKIVFDNAVRQCATNSEGKVVEMRISNYYISEKDINKLLGYKTLNKVIYEKYDENNDNDPEFKLYPIALSKLPKLNELELDFYGYREYQRDQIGEGVLTNTNLKKLTLLKTELTQKTIDEIASLTNLEEFKCINCEFNENISIDSFKNLTNLRVLEIHADHYPYLKSIPKFIYNNLTNLRQLTLTGNDIKSIPSELSNLKKLEHLNLSDNNIDGEIPESLSSLTNLKYVNFSGNVNIKGKTLTNKSLKNCYYEKKYSLCQAKDLPCFENDVKFKACEDNSTNKNKCGKGIGKCASGKCCSKYGWCGTSEKYCAISQGCQSEFGDCKNDSISTNGKCGAKDGKCPSGKCCSKYGWCGTSEKHCSVSQGCQSEFGQCNAKVDGKCGKGYGNCPSGQCCSKYGWCGKSTKYCGTGCQKAFGKCN